MGILWPKKRFGFGYEDNGEYRSSKLVNFALCCGHWMVNQVEINDWICFTDGWAPENQIVKVFKKLLVLLKSKDYQYLEEQLAKGETLSKSAKNF